MNPWLDGHQLKTCVEVGPSEFSVVAFAIFNAGCGPGNSAPFYDALKGLVV